jgi:hypothetical protein
MSVLNRVQGQELDCAGSGWASVADFVDTVFNFKLSLGILQPAE